jgi:murein DD-endopeptidase MepM/ murein hydrolase activator NlpD
MIKKLKNLVNFKIIILPNKNIQTKAYSGISGIIMLVLYSLIMLILSYLVLSFTPLNYLMPIKEYKYYGSKEYQVKQLKDKVELLLKEVEKLKTTNERLRRAILLGDSTIQINPSSLPNLKSEEKQIFDGSILQPIKKIFHELFFVEENIFFIKPVNGYISQEFNPKYGHFGIDFSVKSGTPVFAAANGYVVFSDFTTNDGYMIILAHNENYITVYKHCSSVIKTVRDFVLQGEIIAFSGNTGRLSYGPHLHFEIWKDGQLQNPQNLILN